MGLKNRSVQRLCQGPGSPCCSFHLHSPTSLSASAVASWFWSLSSMLELPFVLNSFILFRAHWLFFSLNFILLVEKELIDAHLVPSLTGWGHTVQYSTDYKYGCGVLLEWKARSVGTGRNRLGYVGQGCSLFLLESLRKTGRKWFSCLGGSYYNWSKHRTT